MKQFIGAGLLIVITASSVAAQESKLYSDPGLPSREVLDRLNLRMDWSIHVPMDGRRDGFVSVQFHRGQLIAVTRTGVVAAFDANNGRELWKLVVGKPDENTLKPTYNARSILLVRGVQLYAIDRKTGSLQWQYRMPFGVSTAPVADERQIYLSGINSQVAAFDLPAPGDYGSTMDPDLRTEGEAESRSQKDRSNLIIREVHPEQHWKALTNHRLDYTPILTPESIFYVTPGGNTLLYSSFPLDDNPIELYRQQLEDRVTAVPGVFHETAYIATADTNLNAVSVSSGIVRWRYSAGNPITRQPFTTDTDVYFTDSRKGLVRLDRESGKAMWKLPFGRTFTEGAAEVERVMAVNPKFIYGADSSGRLRVLDRATGRQLSYYEPFRNYNFPIANEATDRLLLAANNGLVVCLHDREFDRPLAYRKFEEEDSSPEARAKKLEERLARKVSEKEAPGAIPLFDVLESFRRKYGIEIFLSDRVFTDAGLPTVRTKPVLLNRVENLEVKEYLKSVLAQVNAKYVVVGDTVQIVPASVKEEVVKKNPDEVQPMPAEAPVDNLDPKMRAVLASYQPFPTREKMTLDDFVDLTLIRFPDIKMVPDSNAFKAVGIDAEDVRKKELVYPKGKIPFSQVLRDCLKQVNCNYEIKGDTILIVPQK
jgi:outer membrane protein assembly factor BamB